MANVEFGINGTVDRRRRIIEPICGSVSVSKVGEIPTGAKCVSQSEVYGKR